jgi:hypothetical protein
MTTPPMTTKRRPLYGLAFAILATLAGSCLFESSDRCSETQVYDQASQACVCPAGSPPLGTGCVPCAVGDTRPACGGAEGFGLACASDADCAGHEASTCLKLQAPFTCVVTGCATAPDSCTNGHACCDLASLGVPLTLCLPADSCPTK